MNFLNKYLIFDDKIYFELRKDLNFDASRKKKLLYKFLNCSLYGFSNSCVLSKYESHDEKSFVYKFYIMGGHNNNIFDVYLIIDDELRKSDLYVLKNDNIRSQVADLSTIFIKKSLPYIPSSKRNIFNYKSNLCSEINKILVKYSLPSAYYNLLDSEYYVPLSDEDVKKIMPLTAEHIETLRLLEYWKFLSLKQLFYLLTIFQNVKILLKQGCLKSLNWRKSWHHIFVVVYYLNNECRTSLG